jgi:hypothetical protein
MEIFLALFRDFLEIALRIKGDYFDTNYAKV